MSFVDEMKGSALEHRMDRACMTMYDTYVAKHYERAAREGVKLINDFRSFDRDNAPKTSMVEACCPIVSYAGQSLEKLNRSDEAMDLYRFVIHRGCIGTLPFTRLAILLERNGGFEEAIQICDIALENPLFNAPTREGARQEFSKRKARIEKKLEKQGGHV